MRFSGRLRIAQESFPTEIFSNLNTSPWRVNKMHSVLRGPLCTQCTLQCSRESGDINMPKWAGNLDLGKVVRVVFVARKKKKRKKPKTNKQKAKYLCQEQITVDAGLVSFGVAG